MSTTLEEDSTVEPTHKADFPILVKGDNTHKRYCAYPIVNGRPICNIQGECRVSDWSETEKQKAIDDLMSKVQQKLVELSAKAINATEK